MTKILELCQAAKSARSSIALSGTDRKNFVLQNLENWLRKNSELIISENKKDIDAAKKSGLADAIIERLMLNLDRIELIASDLETLRSLSDPVGEVFDEQSLPIGLQLYKQRIPLGVIAVIYESRPNVTIDISSLAIKSGNVVILRGGSETINSNRILVEGIRQSLQIAGIEQDVVQFIDDPSRELVNELLKMHRFVDMLIPRGGAGLHAFCRENSSIPVITGGIGICHLFVDESANLKKSIEVIRNAKIQRPSVCNALDTVLVHENLIDTFVPELICALEADGVQFRIEREVIEKLSLTTDGMVRKADNQDFDTEWLSLVLGIKSVAGLDDALAHISKHSTSHSDGILTENRKNAERFIQEVDSAAVYVNASTRFTDGAQFGLGAEAAVSTQKLHARGPLALRELTSYKWVGIGDYLIRS